MGRNRFKKTTYMSKWTISSEVAKKSNRVGKISQKAEGAMGNSYSREKNHELIKEHSYFWN